MNIAYITLDSIAEGVGTSQVKKLVLKLNSAGNQVTLISFEKQTPSEQLISEMKDAGVAWHPVPFGKFGTFNGVIRILRLKNRIHRLRDVDLFHCRSDLTTFACVTPFKIKPVLWDVRSLWADQKTMVDSYQNGFVKLILKYIERRCAHKSNAVNMLTHQTVEILEKRNKSVPRIRSVIPTCVDLELFRFQPKKSFTHKCLLSGTINDFYDVELISEFINVAWEQHKVSTTWLRPIETLQNFCFPGIAEVATASHQDMPGLVAEHDFGLILCKRDETPALLASSPTKAAEFLATGRPLVVSPKIGDLSQLIEENKVGVVIRDRSEVKAKLDELLQLIADHELPQRCRSVAEKYYDLDNGVQSYNRIYGEMLRS